MSNTCPPGTIAHQKDCTNGGGTLFWELSKTQFRAACCSRARSDPARAVWAELRRARRGLHIQLHITAGRAP